MGCRRASTHEPRHFTGRATQSTSCPGRALQVMAIWVWQSGCRGDAGGIVTRMGRDAGFFVLAGGSVARPTASAIEPDRPRALVRRAGPPPAPFRASLEATSNNARYCLCIWRHGRQMFILPGTIAEVRGPAEFLTELQREAR